MSGAFQRQERIRRRRHGRFLRSRAQCRSLLRRPSRADVRRACAVGWTDFWRCAVGRCSLGQMGTHVRRMYLVSSKGSGDIRVFWRLARDMARLRTVHGLHVCAHGARKRSMRVPWGDLKMAWKPEAGSLATRGDVCLSCQACAGACGLLRILASWLARGRPAVRCS